MTDQPRGLIGLLARFGLVGVANTVVGFAIIQLLQYGAHLQAWLANAIAYGLVIGMSFLLNRRFVFASDGGARGELVRFLLVALLAFLANQAVLAIALKLSFEKTFAQLSGMVTYTAMTFLLSRYFVFSRASSASAAGQSASKT